MKNLLNLYWQSPKIIFYHLVLFLISMLFVPAYAAIPIVVLERPICWLVNDFFEWNLNEGDLRILLACACSFWLGVFLYALKPNIFKPFKEPNED